MALKWLWCFKRFTSPCLSLCGDGAEGVADFPDHCSPAADAEGTEDGTAVRVCRPYGIPSQQPGDDLGSCNQLDPKEYNAPVPNVTMVPHITNHLELMDLLDKH